MLQLLLNALNIHIHDKHAFRHARTECNSIFTKNILFTFSPHKSITLHWFKPVRPPSPLITLGVRLYVPFVFQKGKPKRPCYYCGEEQSQLVRHLKRKHKTEDAVVTAQLLPKAGTAPSI